MAGKSKKIPLYQKIFNDLFKDLNKGKYKAGDQIPTEKELMERYKTSRITVSKALSELKERNYINRQKGSGSFVTSRNKWLLDPAKNIRKSKPIIAVVIPSPSASISIELEVLQGIMKISKKLGYAMSIYNNDDSDDPNNFEKNLISELVEEQVAGVLLFPGVEDSETPEIYSLMSRKSIPYVIIDRSVFGVDAPRVTSDNRDGFYSLVEYVVSRGHKRIAYVSGNTYESSCRTERFYGYVKALTDNHLDVDDALIVHNLFPDNYSNVHYNSMGEMNREYTTAIKEMISKFTSLDNPPTAIVVTNDYLAGSLINILAAMGYSIPDDFSITGYDGLISNMLLSPVLTTVYQDFRAIGNAAVHLLDEIIENPSKEPETVKVPTRLFIGNSVRKI